MKKKRSDAKKNESSNAKNGGGGSSSSDNNSNNSNSNGSGNNAHHDKHHNQSSPCSNLAAAIAQEIFPSLPSTLRDVAGIDLSQTANINGDNGGNDDTTAAAVDQAMEKFALAMQQKQPPPQQQLQQSQPPQQQQQEQPLLGYMIYRYLIEERMQAREEQVANNDMKKNGNTTTANTNNATTATKKKKSKKKKKKKGSSAIMSAENGDDDKNVDAEAEEHNELEENECQSTTVAGGASAASASEALTVEVTPPTTTLPSPNNDTKEEAIENRTQILPSLSVDSTDSRPSYLKDDCCTKNEQQTSTSSKNRRTGLDRLLDSIIDSGQSSSILDSGDVATNHRRGGGRTIEIFAAYLRRKFESHMEQTKNLQHSQQQKKEKAKGGGGVSTATTTATTTPNSIIRGGESFKDILPTISFKDVNESVSQSIDCRKCRTSATSFLRSLAATSEDNNFCSYTEGVEIELSTGAPSTMTKHPAIVLNEKCASIIPSPSSPAAAPKNGCGLSIPVSGIFSDDIDDAFSYLNMDEVDLETGEGFGGGGDIEVAVGGSTNTDADAPQSSSFHLELRPISQANAVRYLQIGTVTGKKEEEDDNGSSVQAYPLKTSDIIDIVKFILLPCGLSEDVLGEYESSDPGERYNLSSEDLTAISNEAFLSMNSIHTNVYGARQSMHAIKEIMERADEANTRTGIDTKTPQLLREADEKIEILLKQLGDVTLQVFKTTCFVGWATKRGPKLLRFAHCLWDRYNKALESLIGPTLQHRGHLLRASARERTVPQAYFNTVVRNSLEELVKAKITAMSSLLHDFSKLLDGEEVFSPSAMLVEVFVVRAFRQHVEKNHPKVSSMDNIFPDQASEELLQQLIAARIHLSQTTINAPLCDGIITKVKEQRDALNGLCKTIRKIIIAMEDFAPETKIEFLRRGYESNESSYYDLVKSHDSLCDTDADFEARDSTLLLKISVNLVMQWLILLCSRQCNESSLESLVLPSRLEKWLDSESVTEITQYEKEAKVECEGNGGERRISSIVGVLLYRWLEARCSEWHAELTRDELLQSMEIEDAVVVNDESGRAGKKKKSKRKSGGENKRRDKVEKNDLGGPSSVEQKRVEMDAAHDETMGSLASEGVNIEGECKMTISIVEESAIDEDKQKENIDDLPSSPEGATIQRGPSTGSDDAIYDYCPGVGVVDGKHFFSAEVYLVNRLQLILMKGADSSTPVCLA